MARDSKDSQLIELKDTIKELNSTIKNLNAMISEANKREQEHLEREKVLQEQIDYLTKKLFGHSSEKRDDIEGQYSLFNEAEAESAAPDPLEKEFITIPSHSRKKKTTMADKFANLPVQREYIDIPEDALGMRFLSGKEVRDKSFTDMKIRERKKKKEKEFKQIKEKILKAEGVKKETGDNQ